MRNNYIRNCIKIRVRCEITSLFQNEKRNVILKTGRFGQKYLLITFRENVSLTPKKISRLRTTVWEIDHTMRRKIYIKLHLNYVTHYHDFTTSFRKTIKILKTSN